MKLFDQMERRGVLTLLPLLLIVLMLAILIDVIDKPVLMTLNEQEVVLQPFDPNSFEYEQLRESGVPTAVAAGIVRWRRYGKVCIV